MNQFYLYDEDKLFTGIELRSRQYDEDMEEIDYEDGTFIRPEDGLYKAMFDGTKWIETIANEELEELNKVTIESTLKDRVDTLEGAVVEIMEATL
ncbi:hypothetical protein CW677_08600 [Macrococcoides caseolyticum]|uniref:hypothetical protein n=1 Tax=Macrococcoides caseolyticum TaxID=69966 RepID=UPI000C34B12F|nr:hypothetical protein [Macrococcus caseolyticus]PKE47227.1 hypothetical protein CW677_08600 [Macrococcus caseolyticus]